jgi:DNA-binding NarL/FixJ family response regulator
MEKNIPLRVLIADESPVFRFGLATLLKNLPFIDEVAEVSDNSEAFGIIKKKTFDLVFFDSHIQKINSFKSILNLSKDYPQIKIVFLLIDEQYVFFNEILKSGAHGYLLKNCDFREITVAINEIQNGRQYFTPSIRELISLNELNNIQLKKSVMMEKNILEIMFLMYHEKTSKEIAGLLNLSCRTVEGYRTKILRMTNSVNMVGILKYIFEKGIHANKFLNEKFSKYCIKKNYFEIDFVR